MPKNIATYIKNLGKSVAFSTMDHIKEQTENTSSFVETNQELFTDIYTNIKNYKTTLKRIDQFIKTSKLYEAAEIAVENTFDSIRTGELYSKKREDFYQGKALGSMGEFSDDGFDLDSGGSDTDFDSELGGWDFDDDDLNFDDGDEYIAKETDKSVKAATGAITETIADAAKYQVANDKVRTNLLYTQSVVTHNAMNEGFSKIHESMQSIANAQLEAMKVLDQNNQTFFNTKLQLDRDRNEMMAEMLKIQRSANAIVDKKEKEREDLSYSGITDANGMPDIKQYIKAIKKNAKGQLGMFGAMSDMMGEDSNIFLTFAANPLKGLTDALAKYLVPTTVDMAIKSLDESISGFFGSIIAKFNHMAKDDEENPIGQILGKIFGVSNKVKSSLDTSNYLKGPVPFDGITRKSIIEVIPFYLRQIAAATTGQEEVVYDYKSGRFIKAKTVQDSFKSLKESAVRNGTSDIRGKAVEYIKDKSPVKFESLDQEKKFYDDLDRIMTRIYNDGGYLNSKTDRVDFSNKTGASEENVRIFLDSIWPNLKRSDKMKMANNVMGARTSMTRNMEDMERDGYSVYNALFNDSKNFALNKYDADGYLKEKETKSPLLTVFDAKGHNVFFYLQETLRELMWQRLNWGEDHAVDTGNGIVLPNGGATILSSTGAPLASRRPSGRKVGRSIDDVNVPAGLTENQRRKQSKQESDRRNFINRMDSLMEKHPNSIDMSELDPDEREMYYKIRASIETQEKTEELKNISHSDYTRLTRWYDKINTYGKGDNAEKQWTDVQEMVQNTPGIVNQLRKAKSIKDKFAVLKIGSSNVRDDVVNLVANTVTKADEALYKLIFGDDKEIASEDGKQSYKSFMDAMIGKMQDSFTRFNSWLDEKILEPLKKKLGIESFGDIPKKVAAWFGVDLDSTVESAKDKIKDFFEPVRDSIKEAGNSAFEFVKESLDTVADATGLNGLLESAKDFFKTTPENGEDSSENSDSSTDEIADRASDILDEMRTNSANTNDISDTLHEINNTLSSVIRENSPGTLNSINNYVRGRQRTRGDQVVNSKGFRSIYGLDSHFDPITGLIRSDRDIRVENMSNQHVDSYRRRPMPFERNPGLRSDERIGLLRAGLRPLLGPMPPSEDQLARNREEQELRETGNRPFIDDIQQHASGTRYVEKAGITAISEGELIVPANLNPFNPNRENVDIDEQSNNEDTIINKVMSKLRKGEKIQKRAEGTGRVAREGEAKDPFGKRMVDTLFLGARSIQKGLFGGGNVSDEEFESKLKDYKDTVKETLPKAIGGGVIGGAVSLLTGMVGGPLLGAAVGASINITRHSNALQNMLFGEILKDDNGQEILDDDGKVKRSGGIISEKIQKLAPTIAKFGVVGGLAGLITPLGPLGGILVGSALGYARTNEDICKSLFGEAADPESGLFSKNRRDWLKKNLPSVALGAIGTMVVGPFGLVGNAVLGSGLGLLSTTNEFKDAMFGPEHLGEDGKMIRDGGIIGSLRTSVVEPMKQWGRDIKDQGIEWIKNDIIKPIANALDPISNQIKLMFQAMFDKIADGVNGMFQKILGDPLDVFVQKKLIEPLSGMIQGVVKVATKPAGWLLSRPSAMIGGIGDKLRSRQIKRGTANYMTAKERLDWREEKGLNRFKNDAYLERDKVLSQLDGGTIDETLDLVTSMLNRDDELEYKTRAQDNSDIIMRSTANKLNNSERRRLRKKLLNARSDSPGSLDAIDSIIDGNSTMSPREKEILKNDIKSNWRKMASSNISKYKARDARSNLSEEFAKKGITGVDFNDKKSMRALKDALDKEKTSRTLDGEAPIIDTTEQINDKVKELIDVGRNTNTILEQIRVGDNNYRKRGSGIEPFADVDYSRASGTPTPDEESTGEVELDSNNELRTLSSRFKNFFFESETSAFENSPAGAGAASASLLGLRGAKHEGEEEDKKYSDTEYGILSYIKSTDGSWVLENSPENQKIQKQLEENKSLQKSMVDHLSGIRGGLTSFFKNFFIGNKETDQEPWWKSLLKTGGLILASTALLAPIWKWLCDSFNIDEKYNEAKDSFLDFVKAPAENGGLGMSGELGEKSLGSRVAGAAGRLYVRGGGTVSGMLDKIPGLRNSNILQATARGIDRGRDSLLHAGSRAINAVKGKFGTDKFLAKYGESLTSTLLSLDEKNLIYDDLARAVTSGEITVLNAAENGYDPQLIRAISQNPDEVADAVKRAVKEPGIMSRLSNSLRSTRAVKWLQRQGGNARHLVGALGRGAGRIGNGILGVADNAIYHIPDAVRGLGRIGSSVLGSAAITGGALGGTAIGALTNSALGEAGARAIDRVGSLRGVQLATGAAQRFNAIGRPMRQAVGHAAGGLVDNVIRVINGLFSRIATRIPSNAASGCTRFVRELAESIVSRAGSGVKSAAKLTGKAGKKLAAFLSTGGVLGVVDSAAGFISGYQEAASIFSIVEGADMGDGKTVQLTDGMKILGGIIRALNNIATFGLVPEKIIVNLALKHIAPALGFDTSTIENMRAASKAEVDKYNADNGKELSIEQYNYDVKGQKSIFKKMGDSQLAKSGMQVIKEGIIPTVKSMAGKALDFVEKFGPSLIELLGYATNVAVTSLRIGADIHNENDQAWEDTTSIDESDPLAPIKKIIFYGVRGIMVLPALALRITSKIGKWFSNHSNDFSSVFSGLGGDIAEITDAAVNGGGTALFKIWFAKDDTKETTGGLGFEGLRFVGKVITRLAMTIPALVTTVTQGVVPAVSDFISGLGDLGDNTLDMFWGTTSKFFMGDLKGAVSNISENIADAEGNPFKIIGNVIGGLASAAVGVMGGPVSIIAAAWGGLNWALDGLASEDQRALLEDLKSASSPVDSMKKWWTDSDSKYVKKDGDNMFMSGLKWVGNFIWKILNTPAILITNIFNMIGDGFGGIKDKITEKFQSIKETVGSVLNPLLDLLGLDGYFDLKITDKKKDEAAKKADKAIEQSKNGYGDGVKGGSRSGSKPYYQKDPEYASVSFNSPQDTVKQTIGDSGCAPVVAANLINRVHGTNVNVKDTAKYAIAKGYKVPNQGTKPEYFGDVLNAYDVAPEYMKDPNAIVSKLKDGRPVILLGSKSNDPNTPFKNNSHYVLATGVDNTGNILIDDPMNKRRTVKYSRDKILRYVSVGVAGSSKSLTMYDPTMLKGQKGLGIGGTETNFVHQDLGKWSDIDPKVFDDLVKRLRPDSGFAGMGSTFVEAGKKSGLDPRYIFAHACVETGWGTSNIFRKKHNCFGIAAYDSDPYNSATSFSNTRDGIIKGAIWIRDHYYNKGKTSLALMKAGGYATDPKWHNTIASLMGTVNKYSPNLEFRTANGSESALTGDGSYTSSSSTEEPAKEGFWSKFASYQANIMGAVWGDAYSALYGETKDETTDSGTTSSDGSYSKFEVANPSGTADNFFASTMKGSVISSKYGESRGGGKRHAGIDYAVPKGTPIYSPVDGVVSTNSNDPKGFGNYAVIKDANGKTHFFGHMAERSKLKVGQKVSRGDQVGVVGSTGHSTGPHLHYEIRDSSGKKGTSIDPNAYFSQSGLGNGPKVRLNKSYDTNNTMERSSAPISFKTTNKGEGAADTNTVLIALVKVIVETLATIANNTDKLSQIVELLSKVTGTNIDPKQLQSTQNNTKVLTDALGKALGMGSNSKYTPVATTDEDNVLTQNSKYLVENLRKIAAS